MSGTANGKAPLSPGGRPIQIAITVFYDGEQIYLNGPMQQKLMVIDMLAAAIGIAVRHDAKPSTPPIHIVGPGGMPPGAPSIQ